MNQPKRFAQEDENAAMITAKNGPFIAFTDYEALLIKYELCSDHRAELAAKVATLSKIVRDAQQKYGGAL